jgi:acyl phosphate:glycerol-3-phosphate acyltransferase
MLIYAIVAVVSYLLGSIPFGYILVRLFRGEDVRATGSGNIGATNVMRSGSKGLGIATLILDAAKGYCAVALAAAFATSTLAYQISPAASSNRSIAMALSAAFAILGHIFPVWLKFKGGKGVATGVGSFLALAPKAVLVVLLIFAAIVAVSRYVSLGSIVATAAFPVFALLFYRGNISPAFVITTLGAAALIIAKHHQNIRRLLAGTENRFGSKKGANA